MIEFHPISRHRSDRASTLLIFPAAVMVLIVLTAIAADLSSVHLAQRQLSRTVSQAAEDAAGAVDAEHLRAHGVLVVDREVATRIVMAHLAADSFNGEIVGTPTITVSPDGLTVAVSATARVPLPFSQGIPGSPRFEHLSATGVGRLTRTGDAP